MELDSELQQDEWSLSNPVFGDIGQLKVIGWSGEHGRHKLYLLKCAKCSEDPELFGQGCFRSLKGDLVRGQVPCGCSKIPKWSKDQYTTLCSRKAEELGYKFLAFLGEWKGRNTKIKLSCEKHGEWDSGIISTLINRGQGCPRCKADTIAEARTKPDDVMIQSFHDSGAFHPDTQFWRSEREDTRGYRPYWYVSCPECGEVGESYIGNLQQGKHPCACNMHRQQECYINLVTCTSGAAVAIKFGIARDSKQRAKDQNRASAYAIKQHSVYTFQDVSSCKKAERECKKELETGVVLKRDMPDGYTETTWVYNLDKIIEIYERNGGVLKQPLIGK